MKIVWCSKIWCEKCPGIQAMLMRNETMYDDFKVKMIKKQEDDW